MIFDFDYLKKTRWELKICTNIHVKDKFLSEIVHWKLFKKLNWIETNIYKTNFDCSSLKFLLNKKAVLILHGFGKIKYYKDRKIRFRLENIVLFLDKNLNTEILNLLKKNKEIIVSGNKFLIFVAKNFNKWLAYFILKNIIQYPDWGIRGKYDYLGFNDRYEEQIKLIESEKKKEFVIELINDIFINMNIFEKDFNFITNNKKELPLKGLNIYNKKELNRLDNYNKKKLKGLTITNNNLNNSSDMLCSKDLRILSNSPVLSKLQLCSSVEINDVYLAIEESSLLLKNKFLNHRIGDNQYFYLSILDFSKNGYDTFIVFDHFLGKIIYFKSFENLTNSKWLKSDNYINFLYYLIILDRTSLNLKTKETLKKTIFTDIASSVELDYKQHLDFISAIENLDFFIYCPNLPYFKKYDNSKLEKYTLNELFEFFTGDPIRVYKNKFKFIFLFKNICGFEIINKKLIVPEIINYIYKIYNPFIYHDNQSLYKYIKKINKKISKKIIKLNLLVHQAHQAQQNNKKE